MLIICEVFYYWHLANHFLKKYISSFTSRFMFGLHFPISHLAERGKIREKLLRENLSTEKALNDWLSYWKMANSKKESRKSIKLRSDYVVDGGERPSLSHRKKGFESVAVKIVNAAALRTWINTENFRNKNKLFAITDALFAHEIYYFYFFLFAVKNWNANITPRGDFVNLIKMLLLPAGIDSCTVWNRLITRG